MPAIKKPIKVTIKNSKKRGPAEDVLAKQLSEAGITDFRRNARFIPGRKFEADFYFPRLKLVFEVDGGLWMAVGGHTSGQGAARDRERDILGYLGGGVMTLRVSTSHVRSGEAIAWLLEVLRARELELYGSA